MRLYFFLILFLSFSFHFCKSQVSDKQECYETANKLLNYFKNKDTLSIAKLIGPDLKSTVKSMRIIYGDCDKLCHDFEINGYPNTENFEYIELPENPLYESIVKIKIIEPKTKLLLYWIEVYFAPKRIYPHQYIGGYSIEFDTNNIEINTSPPPDKSSNNN